MQLAGGNRPTSDEVLLQNYFTASQVRLIMHGFADSNTQHYAVREFVICPEFCLDLVENCTCESTSIEPFSSITTTVVSTSTMLTSSAMPVEPSPTPSSVESVQSSSAVSEPIQTSLTLSRSSTSTTAASSTLVGVIPSPSPTEDATGVPESSPISSEMLTSTSQLESSSDFVSPSPTAESMTEVVESSSEFVATSSTLSSTVPATSSVPTTSPRCIFWHHCRN